MKLIEMIRRVLRGTKKQPGLTALYYGRNRAYTLLYDERVEQRAKKVRARSERRLRRRA